MNYATWAIAGSLLVISGTVLRLSSSVQITSLDENPASESESVKAAYFDAVTGTWIMGAGGAIVACSLSTACVSPFMFAKQIAKKQLDDERRNS